MAHKTGSELRAELEKAETDVRLGGRYVHYRHPEQEYTVTDLVIIEATDGVGVVYRAEYEELKGIEFVRPIESFLGDVETAGGTVRRFTLSMNDGIL
jgi:hypothetical protein